MKQALYYFKIAWNGRDPEPMTANRLTSTFSVDERTAIYDYSIKHTEAPPKPEEFTLDITGTKDKEELSEKEKLALERDAKRRRTKYKSVHTSKKSQTEIMREVIDNQMALYKQWIEQKREQERKEKDKAEKLKKEKHQHDREKDLLIPEKQESTQYHYIETTYSQSTAQWGQTMPYPETYGNQYYGDIQTNQGIITDWSHVYQTGLETDIYADTDQYQLDNGDNLDQPATPIDFTSLPYTISSGVLNSNVSSEAYNGNSQEDTSHKESSSKNQIKEHSGSKVRFKEPSPYEKRRSREKVRRHERESKRHRSRDRRKERRDRKSVV